MLRPPPFGTGSPSRTTLGLAATPYLLSMPPSFCWEQFAAVNAMTATPARRAKRALDDARSNRFDPASRLAISNDISPASPLSGAQREAPALTLSGNRFRQRALWS